MRTEPKTRVRGSTRGIVIILLAAAGALVPAACGGRAAARAVTTAPPPPIAVRQHPARLHAKDATPAVRLDRPAGEPAACDDDCGEAEDVPAAPGSRVVIVRLGPGMTLYSLARRYGVTVDALMRHNGISDPRSIRVGTRISIPVPPSSGRRATGPPDPDRATDGGARPAATILDPPPAEPETQENAYMSIAWPLDGRITGAFGARGSRHHHDGIDIDGTRGEEIRAVADGIVVRSGNEGKYGRTVVIDHGNGITTLYAHASRLFVREGDEVRQGEAIAEVGASGNASGTHLHFEVRRDGEPVDPLPWLKPGMMGAASN